MRYKITTPPTIEPVSLTEVKDHLGIADDASDFALSRRITGARQWVEDYCSRSLINQTIQFRVDTWPDDGIISVPFPELVSVTSVKYIDTAGDEQTVDAADYVVDTYDNTIRPAWGETWPTHRSEKNAVRVVYVSGYGTAATDVPVNIVESIISIVGHWTNYPNQMQNGLHLTQVPSAVRRVLDNYRTSFV